MPDLYATYAALAAAEVEGRDYTRTAVTPRAWRTAVIAIHGGGIEDASGDLAREVTSGGKRFAFYEFAGIKPVDAQNADLHITSTNFDEPLCVSLVAASSRVLSLHGFTGTTGVAETAVGGLDGPLKDWVIRSLRAAGFTVTAAPSEIAGTDPANICSRNLTGAGVQLELSRAQRQAFVPNGDLSMGMRASGLWTQVFYDYAAALTSIADLPVTADSTVDVWQPAALAL